MNKGNLNKGLTLIEVIVYIALFSILMTGVLTCAYQLLEASGKLNTRAVVEEEGNFVLRKINWAMIGVNPNSPPSVIGSGCNQSLYVTKTDSTLNPILIRFNTVGGINYIEMSEAGGSYIPLTTSNVIVSCLKFGTISGNPKGTSATATINGIDFTITKYIRN